MSPVYRMSNVAANQESIARGYERAGNRQTAWKWFTMADQTRRAIRAQGDGEFCRWPRDAREYKKLWGPVDAVRRAAKVGTRSVDTPEQDRTVTYVVTKAAPGHPTRGLLYLRQDKWTASPKQATKFPSRMAAALAAEQHGGIVAPSEPVVVTRRRS